MQINVLGLASGSFDTYDILSSELEMSLMDYLNSKGVLIASSCRGAGVCQKCIVNNSLLSCQILLKDFLKESNSVEISYR